MHRGMFDNLGLSDCQRGVVQVGVVESGAGETLPLPGPLWKAFRKRSAPVSGGTSVDSTVTWKSAVAQPDWIELVGRRVRLAAVRTEPDRSSRLLSAARTHKSVVCLCRKPALPLVTRCSQTTGRHHLTVWPEHSTRALAATVVTRTAAATERAEPTVFAWPGNPAMCRPADALVSVSLDPRREAYGGLHCVVQHHFDQPKPC